MTVYRENCPPPPEPPEPESFASRIRREEYELREAARRLNALEREWEHRRRVVRNAVHQASRVFVLGALIVVLTVALYFSAQWCWIHTRSDCPIGTDRYCRTGKTTTCLCFDPADAHEPQ